MTLSDYLGKHYRSSTARLYAFEINHYLQLIGGEKAALQTSYGDLVNHLESLRIRYQNPATVNRILCSIKSYYNYLIASGRRLDHPASNLILKDDKTESIQLQDLLNESELQQLLEPRKERYQNLAVRNQIVLGLLVHQALLVREIVGLQIDDIQLEKGRLIIGGNNGRILALKANQILPLKNYLEQIRPAQNKQETEQLLLTSRGSAERGEGIHYLIETLRHRFPTKRLTPTSIRQSVIAEKLKAGMNLRKVQAFAGHRKASTTEKYRQSQLEELRKVINRFHPLAQS